MDTNQMNQQPQYIPPMPPYGVPGVEQGPRKPSIGDRIGYFFLAWLPAIACLGLQIIIGCVYAIGMGIVKMVLFMMEHPEASQSVAMDYYMEEVMKALTGGVFFYHLLSLPIFGVWYYFGCKKPKLKESVKHVSWKAVVIATIGGIVMLLMSNGLVGIETYLMPEYVKNFVESMLIGKSIRDDVAVLEKEIKDRYHALTQKPLIACIKDAHNRYMMVTGQK